MQSTENPEINNYASLSIVSEVSINGYDNTIQQDPKESIKTCVNFYRYLTCLIHFRNEYYIDGPTYTFQRFAKNRRELIEMQSGAAIYLIFLRLQITVKGLQTLQGRDTMEHEITQDVLGVSN
jgi:hypothetical protein